MNYPTPYANHMHQAKNLRIGKLILAETGTYNQQYIRPYTMDLRGENLQTLKQVTEGADKFSRAQLSGVTNRIMAPSAVPETTSNIVNGWNQKRYRYMMELVYEKGGLEFTELILGYTEYDGISLQNSAIDPAMRFFVNSATVIRQSAVMTSTGMQPIRQIANSSHVIEDHNWQKGKDNIFSTPAMYSLRPQDVYSVMDTAGIYGSNIAPQVVDSRVMTNKAPQLSNRRNSTAAEYVASMLNSFRTANISDGGTHEEVIGSAMGLVREALTSQNVFLNKIRSLEGRDTSVFTFGELRNIDPNVDHVKRVITFGQVQRDNQLHHTGQSAEWHSSDIETQYAAILAQAVPALMMEYGLVNVIFTSTNNTLTAGPVSSMLSAKSFSNTDLSQPCNAFIQRFEVEIIRDLTYNNEIQYYIEGGFDLLGQSKFSISLNGQSLIEYTVPSFADALFTPMVTYNAARPHQLSDQFNTLLDNVITVSPHDQYGGYATIPRDDYYPQMPASTGYVDNISIPQHEHPPEKYTI